MSPCEAFYRYSNEELNRWFRRRMRRRRIAKYCLKCLSLALVSADVFFCTITFMMDNYGHDAWPSGVCLSLLFLYTGRTFYRYWMQEDESDD